MPIIKFDSQTEDIVDLHAQLIFPDNPEAKRAAIAWRVFEDIVPAIQESEKILGLLEGMETKMTNYPSVLKADNEKAIRLLDEEIEEKAQFIIDELLKRKGFVAIWKLMYVKSLREPVLTGLSQSYYAGRVLIRMLQMNEAGIGATLTKAYKIIEQESIKREERIKNPNFNVVRGKESLRKSWDSFKNISHWMVAYWWLYGEPKKINTKEFVLRDGRAIEIVNYLAMNILQMAESYTIGQGPKRRWPLLNTDDVWVLPPDINVKVFPFELPPLESWARNMIEK